MFHGLVQNLHVKTEELALKRKMVVSFANVHPLLQVHVVKIQHIELVREKLIVAVQTLNAEKWMVTVMMIRIVKKV